MPESQFLSSLVINQVDTVETLDAMDAAGLVNHNEFYLVEEGDFSIVLDEQPTEGSRNLVTSGGIYQAIQSIPIPDTSDYSTATNLVNGSAEGSLRGVETFAESALYTIGYCAFAEGYNTRASGNYSHAEGDNTFASGNGSHAEGYSTGANGYYSHAEGKGTTASGDCSHAEGFYTTASRKSQHVQGEYNIAETGSQTERGTYAHIVGNGTSSFIRSNAHTLDWSGNAWFAGDVYVGSTSGTNKDEGSVKLATMADLEAAIGTAIGGSY